ncbi:uncharacterized protein C8R40DRAFT_770877 [Lentinula edodes]|uniref:uncharacterized protein n=1 Tax=Lentinula edodes TaxID=5353 RepID=UPI001E8CE436|nr:uncharacterized protein C8R40DRAFT_770877 [Lentinula edodes]KAH7878535.1 hypothetical protein C8R40DRAFT_770877 [Lentinula edodes]
MFYLPCCLCIFVACALVKFNLFVHSVQSQSQCHEICSIQEHNDIPRPRLRNSHRVPIFGFQLHDCSVNNWLTTTELVTILNDGVHVQREAKRRYDVTTCGSHVDSTSNDKFRSGVLIFLCPLLPPSLSNVHIIA